jgi:hypothetical protein
LRYGRAIKHVTAALSCALAVFAIGCGSGQGTTPAESAHARAYVIDHIKARMNSAEWLPPLYRSAADLLGNVQFADGGDGRPKALTQAVVVGRVTDVQPGFGFADPASGVEGRRFYDGIMVPFDSKDALWRTVHLTLDVDEVLSGIPTDTEQIRIGLGIGNVNSDDQHIRDGLVALGRTVWFLQRDYWPGFSYDKSLYSDIEGGRLIAQVMPDDRLVFPMLEHDGPSAAAVRDTTLAQLRDAADRPMRTVELHREGGIWTR